MCNNSKVLIGAKLCNELPSKYVIVELSKTKYMSMTLMDVTVGFKAFLFTLSRWVHLLVEKL